MSPAWILSKLTEDLLVRIYDSLGSETDRKTWRLVCKEFLRVDARSRRILRVLRVEFLPNLLRRYANLCSLDLSVCSRVDDGTVSLLLRWDSLTWAQGLKTVNLSRATGLRSRGLEMLARACPCLESVDVSHCGEFGDREAAAVSGIVGLRELKMDKCLNVTDVGLAKIAVRCVRLERLSMKWCMEISDLAVDLLCKKCRDLRSLDVSYLKVTNESLGSLASLPKLEVLVMVGCPFVDDAGLRFLETGCPLLQAVDISRCGSVNWPGLISVIRGHGGLLQLNAGYCFSELSITFLQLMKDLKNLKTVIVDGTRVPDSCFEIISSHCKSLVEIGLSKCFGVTNTGIMKLVSGCVNLTSIDLTCCRCITDAAISAIADSCRNLACLKLESCDMITEKGLYKLGSLSTLLEELDLTDCCGVNDRGLEYLSRCSLLVSLKLGLCTNISGKGLFHIGTNCTKLRELDLYRCIGIGDDGLAAISSGCKKLKKLNVSYCKEITDKGMEYIGSFKELSDLEARQLVKITGLGLKAVATGCQKLTYLDLKHCGRIDDSGFCVLASYSRNLRQINLCYCAVSDMALYLMMGNLTRLQDVDLVHLSNITVEGYELALRACCLQIRKVKLPGSLRFSLSSEILETLKARGCRLRWD